MRFRMLGVGVSKYIDEGISDLSPCDKEAGEVFDALCDADFGSCEGAESILLRSGADNSLEATRGNFVHHLKRLTSLAQPDEGLLIYFSGHGTNEGSNSYLVCKDTHLLVIQETALKLVDLFAYLRQCLAKYKVVILDSCKPGFLLGKDTIAEMSSEFQKEIDEVAEQLRDEGLIILASCKADQVSNLMPDGSRSVFTHYLLEALNGGIAPASQGGEITVKDLYDYLLTAVRSWSLENQKQQVPHLGAELTGSLERVVIAKARSAVSIPVTLEPSWHVESVVLKGHQNHVYPTRTRILEPDIWSEPYVISLRPRQVSEVVESETWKIDRKAEAFGEEVMAKCGAMLTSFYSSMEIKRVENTRIEFPHGHVSFSTSTTHRGATTHYSVEVSANSTMSQLLDEVRSKFSWDELEVHLALGKAQALASLIDYARGKNWNVDEYLPGGHAVLMVPAFGRGSKPTKIKVETGKSSTAHWEIVYDLDSVDSAHDMQALISSAAAIIGLEQAQIS